MSWKEIFDIMHPKRNQNNVIQFPTTLTIEKLMHQDVWDLAPISDHNMELLGQFGEGLSFKPLTAQRLIANLATELNKYRLQEEDPI